MNRYAILALFAVCLLSGCDNPNSPENLNTRIKVADTNARRALDYVDDLEAKVSDLEQRVDDLETKLGQ